LFAGSRSPRAAATRVIAHRDVGSSPFGKRASDLRDCGKRRRKRSVLQKAVSTVGGSGLMGFGIPHQTSTQLSYRKASTRNSPSRVVCLVGPGRTRQDDKPTLLSQGIDKNLAHQGRVLGAMSDDGFKKLIEETRAKVLRKPTGRLLFGLAEGRLEGRYARPIRPSDGVPSRGPGAGSQPARNPPRRRE
jgi:hypothetical protein